MSTDSISVIREAEKQAEASEREAKEQAAEIIKANESYLQKAEGESSEEVKALRAKAESKKREVAGNVTEMLF